MKTLNEITLHFDEETKEKLTVKQGDFSSRQFVFTLLKKGQPATFSQDFEIRVNFRRPGGEIRSFSSLTGEEVNINTEAVTFTPDKWCFEKHGSAYADISLFEDGELITTDTIKIKILKAIGGSENGSNTEYNASL